MYQKEFWATTFTVNAPLNIVREYNVNCNRLQFEEAATMTSYSQKSLTQIGMVELLVLFLQLLLLHNSGRGGGSAFGDDVLL